MINWSDVLSATRMESDTNSDNYKALMTSYSEIKGRCRKISRNDITEAIANKYGK